MPQPRRSGPHSLAHLSVVTQPRIVALGGGTGLPTVLRSLRILLGVPATRESLTAIVAVSDDGGSSGRLRQELRMLAPGDVRNCVAAMAEEGSAFADLLQHRLSGGTSLDGHTVGNLLLAALTQQMHGDFPAAVDALSRMAGTGGRVLPATAQNIGLRAEFDSGEVVDGETAIASHGRPIRRLSLDGRARPLPEAIAALVNADAIIVGPGSLYTSTLPVLLVEGVAATIYGLTAPRICVANLMTEPGETDGHSLEQHLDVIEAHAGAEFFDYVLFNTRPIPPLSLARYASQASYPVRRTSSGEWYKSMRIVERDLAWQVQDGRIRHEPASLAAAIGEILEMRRAPEQREASA